MNNKLLYNQKNKKDLLKNLKKEPFERATLSFYRYTKLNNLEILRNFPKRKLSKFATKFW